MSTPNAHPERIVDFSSYPRATGGSVDSATKSVQMSPSRQVITIEDDHDGDLKSYSPTDLRRLQMGAARDVSVLATRFLGPPENLTLDDFIESIGIESFLSMHTARRSMANRRNHVRTILSNQSRCAIDELCMLSQESSMVSRQVAESRAITYWNNLKV